jgi:hypothetical protein
MTTDALYLTGPQTHVPKPPAWLLPATLLWAAVVLALTLYGFFDVPASQPALPTLLAIALPVLAFVLAVRLSPALRTWALSMDPVLLTALQAWRIMGGAFLIVLAFGLLPGLFAWPAGLGDVAVGIAAPFIAWQLANSRNVLTSRRFALFHYAGLADFAIAVTTGVLSRNAIPGLVGEVTSGAMGQFPLALIPTLAVPAFTILHLIVLMQVRAAR